MIEMKYAVYPGSENLDLGSKRVAVLCSSEAQAKHMISFWGSAAYCEPIMPIEVADTPRRQFDPTALGWNHLQDGLDGKCCICETAPCSCVGL